MGIIYLIRHGEIPQSTPRRFIGQRDLPLTDRGKEQIARLAPILASRFVDRVVCSPLGRCLDSARIICLRLGCRPDVQPALKEVSLGGWEGLRVSDVRARYPGAYEARGLDVAGFRPSEGESFADLQHRVWPVFETIAAQTETATAVVAHAGVNRVILCTILGMPLANLFRIDQGYGCLNTIEVSKQGCRIKGLNSLTST
ncbi:MAG: histidine phosphatase family protein [Desulfofustis sp.]|nr:histidine phosphatase family protein [Desulfofustis sp.]